MRRKYTGLVVGWVMVLGLLTGCGDQPLPQNSKDLPNKTTEGKDKKGRMSMTAEMENPK